MTEAERAIREALAAGPTPGPWHHCQPFQSVRAERTLHGTVPAQRVDFVSTKTQPVHKRIIIPMAGEEAHVRSEDMAFIAACNPENIAALLEELDRLTRERDEHARWRAELADKLHATESLVSELRAEVGEMRDVLLRHGFVPCDIPACNCGSWHPRFGYPERMREIGDALAEAGHPLSNENGNMPLNALRELIAERDALAKEAEAR